MSNKYKWIIAITLVLGVVVIAQASLVTTIYMPTIYVGPTITPTPTATPKPTECLSQVFFIKGIKVCFTKIDYQPTTSPLDEWVDIKNLGGSLVDMTGWRISSDSGNKYDFPDDFELKSGQTVRVYTKLGTDGASQLYMNRTKEFWKDTSDCGYLKDADRKTINSFCYSETGFSAAPAGK